MERNLKFNRTSAS